MSATSGRNHLLPSAIVNSKDYPIDQTEHPKRQEIIEQIKAELAEDGCAVIRDFLSPEGLGALLAEAEERKPQAFYSAKKDCNVYLNEGDDSFPKDHPRNRMLPRTNGFVTTDLFSDGTASKQLYFWEPLKQFLAECLGKEVLHIYEDPISSMIVNVGKPQQQFNWHYDTNEFTITLLLKAAESGGYFEYVPDLRTPEDECYDEVKKVLDGDRSRIKRLDLREGDLQFFLGRFSLHQVTPNTGDTDRLLLIMSFTEQAGVIGSMYRVKDLYGKVTEAHYQSEREKTRSDDLVD